VLTAYSSAAANAAENLSPTRDIAGYFVVDGTLGYSVQNWLAQLNAHNILNRHYFINNYQTLYYGNTIGEPFNVWLTVRRNF
jgi:iron complex outermembrane receptor protein